MSQRIYATQAMEGESPFQRAPGSMGRGEHRHESLNGTRRSVPRKMPTSPTCCAWLDKKWHPPGRWCAPTWARLKIWAWCNNTASKCRSAETATIQRAVKSAQELHNFQLARDQTTSIMSTSMPSCPKVRQHLNGRCNDCSGSAMQASLGGCYPPACAWPSEQKLGNPVGYAQRSQGGRTWGYQAKAH